MIDLDQLVYGAIVAATTHSDLAVDDYNLATENVMRHVNIHSQAARMDIEHRERLRDLAEALEHFDAARWAGPAVLATLNARVMDKARRVVEGTE